MRLTIPLVLSAFAATTAAAGGADDTHIFNRAVSGHIARQLPNSVPAECQTYCSPVADALRNKCPLTQCCKSDFATEYFNCFLCVGNAMKETDWTAPQRTYNSYAKSCAASGYTVPQLTFSGQSPGNASTTTTTITTSNPTTNTGTTTTSGSTTNTDGTTTTDLPNQPTTSNTHTLTFTTTISPSVNTETPTVQNAAVDWKSRNDYVPWMVSVMAALAGWNLG